MLASTAPLAFLANCAYWPPGEISASIMDRILSHRVGIGFAVGCIACYSFDRRLITIGTTPVASMVSTRESSSCKMAFQCDLQVSLRTSAKYARAACWLTLIFFCNGISAYSKSLYNVTGIGSGTAAVVAVQISFTVTVQQITNGSGIGNQWGACTAFSMVECNIYVINTIKTNLESGT